MSACIRNVYYAKIDNPDEGLNGVTIREFLGHVRSRYATINQTLIDENIVELDKPIQADLPLAICTRNQKKFQVFAAKANVPISEATMVTTGTKHDYQ